MTKPPQDNDSDIRPVADPALQDLVSRYDELLDSLLEVTEQQEGSDQQISKIAEQQEALIKELQAQFEHLHQQLQQLQERRQAIEQQRCELDEMKQAIEVEALSRQKDEKDGTEQTSIADLADMESREEQLDASMRELIEIEMHVRFQRRLIGKQLRQKYEDLSRLKGEELTRRDSGYRSSRVEADRDQVSATRKIAALEAALVTSHEQQQELNSQLDESRQRIELLEGQLSELEHAARELIEDSENQQRRHDELAQHATDVDTEAFDQLQRRLELATEDLQEAERENRRLQDQLQEALIHAASGGVDASGDGLDWEAEKRRLLAELEQEDGGSDDAASQPQRSEIEELVRRTDQLLAERDSEIAELQQLLREQSGSIEGMAVGAAAISEMLDQDELIHQERENVQQLKEEWEQKLRQAEIEISIERAKLARERAEFEENQAKVQEQLSDHSAAEDAEGGKSNRGRWLARLGLNDGDE